MSKITRLTFTVTLEGITPKIWRTFEVPSDTPAENFAIILQLVMGWTYSHLYRFDIGGKQYESSEFMAELGYDSNSEPYDEMTVQDFIDLKKPIKFIYDYGDNWQHKIVLESIEDYEPREIKIPRILFGDRCCPPEDVGGVMGYKQMLKVLKHPNSEEAESYYEWLGGYYDPEYFDKKLITSGLAFFRRHKHFPGSEESDFETGYFNNI